MKTFLHTILFAVLILPFSLKAQFNTITPIQTKKESISNVFEKEREANKQADAQKKEEDKKKKTKKSTSKFDAKKEIDSLKMLLIQYSLKKNSQNTINYKKIEDTIASILYNKTIANAKPIYKQMDFVESYDNVTTGKIFMPLNKKLNVTSSFGSRIHPIFGTKKMHNGIDLAAAYEDVHSVLDGIVTASGWDNSGGGNFIKVLHNNQFETAYLHLSESYYKVGERVKAGWIIARSGNTGNSTGPHLHFSVKEFGNYINPITFLNDLVKVNNLLAIRYEK